MSKFCFPFSPLFTEFLFFIHCEKTSTSELLPLCVWLFLSEFFNVFLHFLIYHIIGAVAMFFLKLRLNHYKGLNFKFRQNIIIGTKNKTCLKENETVTSKLLF